MSMSMSMHMHMPHAHAHAHACAFQAAPPPAPPVVPAVTLTPPSSSPRPGLRITSFSITVPVPRRCVQWLRALRCGRLGCMGPWVSLRTARGLRVPPAPEGRSSRKAVFQPSSLGPSRQLEPADTHYQSVLMSHAERQRPQHAQSYRSSSPASMPASRTPTISSCLLPTTLSSAATPTDWVRPRTTFTTLPTTPAAPGRRPRIFDVSIAFEAAISCQWPSD